ncbi:MAG: hypothetical protein ACYTGZ_11760 [Planctomycetota bacterium]|jgi:hypothetical protein
MTDRTLATTAVVFAVLLAALAGVALNRYGYLTPQSSPDWEFRNSLLDCKPGSLAVMRPGRVDQSIQRYWFLRFVPEPQTDDLTNADSDVGRYAHVRAAVWEQRPEEEGWYYQAVAFFAFRQLGALSPTEWMQEIRLVNQKDAHGNTKTLLRAQYANTGAARMYYFYDPAESREEAASRGVGWFQFVQEAKGTASDVFYLTPAGYREPPPAPK